jgi:hypothetical protein
LFLCAKHLFVAAMGVPMRATLAMVMAVRAAIRNRQPASGR